jgi:hypothetical protein
MAVVRVSLSQFHQSRYFSSQCVPVAETIAAV